MINIYNYTDYKQFLKDYYLFQKKKKKFFSYQYMADHCGFNSKSYLYKVIRGEKALASSGTLKIAEFMKLKKKEIEYFESMVMFTNAKTVKERDYFFNKLQSINSRFKAVKLRQNQFEYFSNWYNIALREIVTLFDWKNNYSVLAKSLIPQISKEEAKVSVKLLLELELIRRNDNGRFEQTDRSITTGDDIKSLAVNNFQRENLKLAEESIDRFKREMRDIATLTVGVSREGIEQIRKEMTQFRKRLIELVNNDNPSDRVYQINFQTFPVYLPAEEKK